MTIDWKRDLAVRLAKVAYDCVHEDRILFLENDLEEAINKFIEERIVRVYFKVTE